MAVWWLARARPDSVTTVGIATPRSAHTSRTAHTMSFA